MQRGNLAFPQDALLKNFETIMTSKMHLELTILPQPDQFTCGPTCLQAVYRYFGDSAPLPTIINEIRSSKMAGLWPW